MSVNIQGNGSESPFRSSSQDEKKPKDVSKDVSEAHLALSRSKKFLDDFQGDRKLLDTFVFVHVEGEEPELSGSRHASPEDGAFAAMLKIGLGCRDLNNVEDVAKKALARGHSQEWVDQVIQSIPGSPNRDSSDRLSQGTPCAFPIKDKNDLEKKSEG